MLTQTRSCHECLVIDDGSTSKVNYDHQKVKVLYHDKNKGVSAARNTGIQAATGNWLAFLDSDDAWHPEKLKHTIDFLNKHPFYRIVQGHDIWIRNGKRVTQKKIHQRPKGWAFEESINRCMVSASSVVIHRDILKKHGLFDTTLPACEDYDLWCRLLRHIPIGLVPHVTLTRYAGHQDQLSEAYPAMDRFRIRSLKSLLKKEDHQFSKHG